MWCWFLHLEYKKYVLRSLFEGGEGKKGAVHWVQLKSGFMFACMILFVRNSGGACKKIIVQPWAGSTLQLRVPMPCWNLWQWKRSKQYPPTCTQWWYEALFKMRTASPSPVMMWPIPEATPVTRTAATSFRALGICNHVRVLFNMSSLLMLWTTPRHASWTRPPTYTLISIQNAQ